MDCVCVSVSDKSWLDWTKWWYVSTFIYSLHVSMMRHHSESCLILKEKEVSTVMIPEVEELVAKYVPLESQFYQVLLKICESSTFMSVGALSIQYTSWFFTFYVLFNVVYCFVCCLVGSLIKNDSPQRRWRRWRFPPALHLASLPCHPRSCSDPLRWIRVIHNSMEYWLWTYIITIE